jgi:hypothetical protein
VLLSVAEADAVAVIRYLGNLSSAAAMSSTVGAPYLATDGPVCVAGDVVRHSFAYPDPVGDLLECAPPSVVWL